MNQLLLTVAGNLVDDVRYSTSSNGTPVARFRLGSSERRFDRNSGNWTDGNHAYFDVTCWRQMAENVFSSLAKGHPVVVHGRIRQRRVERPVEGVPGRTMTVTYTDLEAVSLGLDLSRCRARFERAPLGPQTGAVETEEPSVELAS